MQFCVKITNIIDTFFTVLIKKKLEIIYSIQTLSYSFSSVIGLILQTFLFHIVTRWSYVTTPDGKHSIIPKRRWLSKDPQFIGGCRSLVFLQTLCSRVHTPFDSIIKDNHEKWVYTRVSLTLSCLLDTYRLILTAICLNSLNICLKSRETQLWCPTFIVLLLFRTNPTSQFTRAALKIYT